MKPEILAFDLDNRFLEEGKRNFVLAGTVKLFAAAET
jgi:hypothetical protein